jgi:hypothetical protein
MGKRSGPVQTPRQISMISGNLLLRPFRDDMPANKGFLSDPGS